MAAFARSLAQARQRTSRSPRKRHREPAFTEREALEASPPLVDLVAGSLDELVATLDGRTIRRFSGAQQTLHTAGARRESVEMTWRQRFLSTLAHPQIAYLLFTLGLLGLTVELWIRAPRSRASPAVSACCSRSSPFRCCRSTWPACC